MNFRVAIFAAVVVLFLITLALVYLYRRYPEEKTLQALPPAIAVTGGLATILGLLGLIALTNGPPEPTLVVTTLPSDIMIQTTLIPSPLALTDTAPNQEQSTDVAEIVNVEASPNVATVTMATLAAIQPTRVAVGEPIYFQSLGSASDSSWRVWGDANGRAAYEAGGYVIWSEDTVSSWLSANLDDTYRELILEVDVTPITYGLVTGYTIAVGWDDTNSYYMFLVTPDGECGTGIIVEQVGSTNRSASCPQPQQNTTVRVRLEIKDQEMRGFIDGQYISTWQLPEYEGGKIGLGAYNGGLRGSGAEAGVKFSNLAIWLMQ